MATPAKPTKQQWDDVKRALSFLYGEAYFMIDGYKIAVCVRQHKMRLVVAVYVNGSMKGRDLWGGRERDADKMPELAKRFYALKSRQLNRAEDIKFYEKHYGKREAKKRNIYERFLTVAPYFSTPGAFIAHIKKHNQSIEIIDYDAYEKAMEPLRIDTAPEVASA